jgi:hypothetical protein
MSEALQSIVTDPFTYLFLVVGIWAARTYLQRRIEKGVDTRFEVQLENHKQALQLATEQARFDYQRRLAGFNLYNEKKHAAAAEIYRALRIAHGHISRLQGVREELSFVEFNTRDIAEYMTSHDVPQGKQEEILSLWGDDKPEAIKQLKPYLRMVEFQLAERKAQEAMNCALLNELYFPDRVIHSFNDLFTIFRKWIAYFKFPPEPGEGVPRPSQDEFDNSLEAVHSVLRSELAEGQVLGTVRGTDIAERTV